MKFSKVEMEKLREIKALFVQIQEKFDALQNETQENIKDYHNENHSLNHCIRWGAQASDELTR
ncbi:hypothetical protein [Paenibacillus gallinarum]|uniref:Uncharacterized protein n=1 Tax=Paenibacillus gallinarum TaxID=2762232 RepID=A0ABR8T3B1_9BACL|nr:hypothetical protein [Paenibacillus gallinarum]MBD7970265.1 hypothetical protein [Paenibacillus gallinarum]